MVRRSQQGRLAAGLIGAVVWCGVVVACATPQAPAPSGSANLAPAREAIAPGRELAAPAPVATAEARPVTTVTVSGASLQELTTLPWLLARERGYLRQEGLDLEFVGLPSPQMLTALLKGDTQYSLDMTGHVTGLMQAGGTLPIRLVAVLGAKPQHAVVAQPQYQSVRDLKGALIGSRTAGDTGHRAITLLWQAHGLDPQADVQFRPMGTETARVAALQAGSVDAVALTPPTIQVAEGLGFRVVGRARDVSDLPQSGIWTLQDRYRDQPAEVVAVLRATLRALQFIHDPANEAEVTRALGRLLEVEDARVAAGLYETIRGTLSSDGTVPERAIEDLIAYLNTQRDTPTALRPDAFAEWQLLSQAQQDLQRAR
jgi:NitT/TauT family transport system substrate-binding protein